MVATEVVRAVDATGAFDLLWLVPAIPLAVAFLNLFVGRRLGKLAGVLASLAVVISFGIAANAVRELLAMPAEDRLVVQHR